MLVKIVLGSYGHRAIPGEPLIELKDAKSAPFEVEDAEAKRIIALGIAEAVDEAVAEIPITKDTDDFVEETDEIVEQLQDEVVDEYIAAEIVEVSLEEMSINELRALAKESGVSATGSKVELIERIKSLQEEEQPPVLEAAEPEV